MPACAGMSCGTGAWRESDASTLYDERTLNVALHPPTDSLKKKSVLERSRFPEADPEPNEGLGTYGTTQSAQRGRNLIFQIFCFFLDPNEGFGTYGTSGGTSASARTSRNSQKSAFSSFYRAN